MAKDFLLPEIGEGVTEGEIVEWLVAEGDQVDADQPLVSVLTDKATVEITSDFSGKIVALHGAEGDDIYVGKPLLKYEGEIVDEEDSQSAEEAPSNNGQATAEDNGASDGDVTDYKLPEIGEGVQEGEVVEWLVNVGDQIGADQPIVSVLTDKATVEITAPQDGEIVELIGEEGETIEVGDVLMRYRGKGGKSAAKSEGSETQAAKPKAAAPKAATPAKRSNDGDYREVDPKDNPSISTFGTPLATPAVRRFASSQDVDLRVIKGSGPNHRITRADVERYLEHRSGKVSQDATATSASAARQEAPSGGERREKIKGLRRAIYNSMTKSKSTVPHFTYVDEVEMDKLVEMRSNLKPVAEQQGIKLTFLPFIVKAVVLALKKYPVMNTSVDDESMEIVYKYDYNLGIATATKAGLTVPVLKAADRKTILECAAEIAELSERARNQKSTMDDITGSTFTITSLGRLGGILATPIINHPETAIMGIHNMEERAVVRNGEIVIRKMMNISVAFDHRIIDGDKGAVFAQEIKSYLEEPGKLLLEMN